jgi:hypothetical protein
VLTFHGDALPAGSRDEHVELALVRGPHLLHGSRALRSRASDEEEEAMDVGAR